MLGSNSTNELGSQDLGPELGPFPGDGVGMSTSDYKQFWSAAFFRH
jgi:hypothetical protein